MKALFTDLDSKFLQVGRLSQILRMPTRERYSAIDRLANGLKLDRSRSTDQDGIPEISDFNVHPAKDFKELCEAYSLVYRLYSRIGLCEPNESKMRYSLLEMLPSTLTLAIVSRDRLVGTGSVMIDSPIGLPLSKVFPDILAQYRAQGRTVAERTMLACEHGSKLRSLRMAHQLIRYGCHWAILAGADDFCLVVHPKHVAFWTHQIGFEAISEDRQCSHVVDHPGVLLRANLRGLLRGEVQPTEITARDILGKPVDAGVYLERYCLSERELLSLFLLQPQLIEKMSPQERVFIQHVYPIALELAESYITHRKK